MNRYPSYKNSNIDWVGEIPSHWEIVRPKYKLNKVTRPIDDDDEIVTCFRDGVVTLRKHRREDGFTNSTKEHGYQQIKQGDLVVHEMDGFAGAIGISDSKGKSTPVYTVVEPDHRTDLKYIAYLLREMSQSGKIVSLARSIRERTTDFRWNLWSNTHFPFPPVNEQKIIANYIDQKTNYIDSLIEKIEKKIELLIEQRTTLINHFITKGLDSNTEMRDSGIEWIGMIPKHWQLTKLKFHGDILTGLSFDKGDLVDEGEGTLVLRASNVQDGKVNFNDNIWVNTKIPNKLFVQNGDILICSTNGSRDLIGKNCILKEESLGMTWGVFMTVFRSKNPEYFYWALNSQVFKSQAGLYLTSTINQLKVTTLKNLVIPYAPDEDEQNRINDFLTKETQLINSVVEKEKLRISFLNEYKQSLISMVVTGKVKIAE